MQSLVTTQNSSYASQWNSQFNNSQSHIISLKQRWIDTYNKLMPHQKTALNNVIEQHIEIFKQVYSAYDTWDKLPLAESCYVKASDLYIDTTMQRLLDIQWVVTIFSKFLPTSVIPIHVYRDEQGRLIAWDGQHTAIVLWLIITQVYGENPNNCMIPVNIYQSSCKNEMRENFVGLNSKERKKSLDPIDLWMQQIYGVRIDQSLDPNWISAEKKQQALEKYDLFVTANKFNNTDQYGAISRLQEINKLEPKVVEWLVQYLSLSTGNTRAADEKEVMIMGNFFNLCRIEKVPVDSNYITELFTVCNTLFNCDFEHHSVFWVKANQAYVNWHKNQGLTQFSKPRFKKEVLHGMPFLVAQLEKSFSRPVPKNVSNSEFVPDIKDLF
jgi:hypothetical protein